ncbi:hypothetical protein CEXT_28811 [Caerostris extrusa]|uniref:Uncharacterized protein n=1 Tax=Caerostris extrusa TaxID=172846 RepID=A0AAV4NXT8_CAEEX|nr:hypothetical protein CEXT_28811 [Caerostris extrusa]
MDTIILYHLEDISGAFRTPTFSVHLPANDSISDHHSSVADSAGHSERRRFLTTPANDSISDHHSSVADSAGHSDRRRSLTTPANDSISDHHSSVADSAGKAVRTLNG